MTDDIAQAVRYLAGPESSWVTGQHLAVDGGHTLRAFVDYANHLPMPDLRQAAADASEFLARLAAYRAVAKDNPDALAFIWWDEMRKAIDGLKARGGRVEPLDAYLGNGSLDVTQVITPRKR